MYPLWTFMALPYTRAEAPGLRLLMRLLCPAKPTDPGDPWRAAPTRTVRGKLHGYLMRLDLSDWCQRTTFFLGRYYELEVQLLMQAVLRPGDRFVDIGANIGMLTLFAARCVGPAGLVDSFEPNPRCVAALKQNLALNGINHVRVHPCALSDAASRLSLNLPDKHTGNATLAPVEAAAESIEVDVCVGDRELAGGPPIRAVKIDVEGFELQVLRGLTDTLTQYRPILITEFIESHFVRAATSGAALEAFLRDFGYLPYRIGMHPVQGRRQLALSVLAPGQPMPSDVVWIHPEWNVVDGLVAAGAIQ